MLAFGAAPRVAVYVDVWSKHVTPAVQRRDDSGYVLRRQPHPETVHAYAGPLLVPPRLPRDWIAKFIKILWAAILSNRAGLLIRAAGGPSPLSDRVHDRRLATH